ncbi:MAG: glycoside hydrolase family 43 protein [Acidimicrobiales bacterium]
MRRQLSPLAVVALVVAVAASAALVVTRSELDEARQQAAAGRLGVAVTKEVLVHRTASLLATTTDLQFRSVERDQFRAALAGTLAELDHAQLAVVDASGQIHTQGQHIEILRTCLGGVDRALNASSVDDTAASVAALRQVGEACRAAEAITGSAESQFPFDFADPFVLRAGDRYYGYATNAGGGNVQLIEADGLGAWRWVGNALPELPAWASPNRTWAPSVLAVAGGYVLYYTVRDTASGRQCISVATSSSPAGPFVDRSAGPLVCQADMNGSIDPSPFVDASGQPYLLWRSDAVPARLWAQALTPDGTALTGAAAPMLVSDQRWELGVIEGPAMVRAGAGYYLFYSARSWNSAQYAMGYATCSGPLGPCTRVTTGGPFFGSQPGMIGPGGQEFFTDVSGELMVAFHAWQEGQVGYPNRRRLHVLRVTFPGGSPSFSPVG